MNSAGYIPRRRGIYLALWTDPEGGICFSIFPISWIKIKKELFVNKRRHFVRVCLRTSQLTVFRGSFFLTIFLQIQRENFFYRPINSDKPDFFSFLVFFGAAASVTAKILFFETVAKREAILNLVSKQWISKDIPSYGSQSERAKIAIHWFGEY